MIMNKKKKRGKKMRIIAKVIELVIDGNKTELEKKLNDLKNKYQVVFDDIYYNDDDDMKCYTLQVKYVEKGIY